MSFKYSVPAESPRCLLSAYSVDTKPMHSCGVAVRRDVETTTCSFFRRKECVSLEPLVNVTPWRWKQSGGFRALMMYGANVT